LGPPIASGGSGDQPADVRFVIPNDGCEEFQRSWLVPRGDHSFRQVDVGDGSFEPACGSRDVTAVLPGDQNPDALCDVVGYVAIAEVESHLKWLVYG